jgi:hypothetical protein
LLAPAFLAWFATAFLKQRSSIEDSFEVVDTVLFAYYWPGKIGGKEAIFKSPLLKVLTATTIQGRDELWQQPKQPK